VTVMCESEHEYSNNLHEKIKLHIPHAQRMTVVFAPETCTEQSYDYVRIFKDEDMTETWHPQEEKFSGSRTWPGKDLPPLEILSDTAWILFHTDSSNVDWGWKLIATGEVRYETSCQQLHWLIQLERVSALVGGMIVEALFHGPDGTGKIQTLEENHGDWFDDAILSILPSPLLVEQFLPHINCFRHHTPHTQEPFSPFEGRSHEMEMPNRNNKLKKPSSSPEPNLLLKQMVRSPLGPNAQILISTMKEHVIEDRGQLPIINEAVYAAAAALISHNNLTEQATMVVKKRIPPSAPLVKVWRVAQKMRQWLAFSDAAAAQDMYDAHEHGGHHRRRPSLYSGTSDEVLEKVCKGAINRAKWLLCIPPFDEEGKVQFTHRHLSRSRCVSADLSTCWNPLLHSSGDSIDMSASAAHELKELLDFRKALSERRRRKKTTTELVLAFLQSDTMVEDLVKIAAIRDERAVLRSKGMELACALLSSLRCDDAKMELLSHLIRGMRSVRSVCKTWLGDRVHFMNGLSGITAVRKKEVTKAFSGTISEVINILSETGPDHKSELTRLAMQRCAIDYESDDHEMLHNCRLLPQVHSLMRGHDEALRSTATALFKLLLRRCVSSEASQMPVPSLFQHDILNVLKIELQKLALIQRPDRPFVIPAQSMYLKPDIENNGKTKARCLLGEPIEIGRRMLGWFAPHCQVKSTHTLAFWLLRHRVKYRRGKTKSRYRVIGTEGCLVRANPQLDSEVVATLETGTMVSK